ncbi:MAG: AAA family ATPase, partial [Saccharofermentanaceae bacterium]
MSYADMENNMNMPLAYRMSPESLDEYIGQEHIIGKGKMLRRMIEADRLSSVILFGPPGVGKTALSRLIARTTSCKFVKLNAVSAGVGDIKKVVADALNPILSEGKKTLLLLMR